MKHFRVGVVSLLLPLVLTCATPAFAADGQFLIKWGSLGTAADQLNRPNDIAIGPTGDVFVIDTNNNRVQRFTSTGTPVSRFSAGGSAVYGLHVDAVGNVFVADYAGSVRKYSGAGALLMTLPGITQARDVVTDGAGNIYVTSTSGNYVRKYASDGSSYVTWTGLSGPRGIALAPSGDLYVAEHVPGSVNRVSQYTSAGVLVRRWGSTGTGDGQFNGDIGVAVGPDGSVYVSEYLNNRIQKFTANGAFVTKWGTSGSADGQFNGVRGVAVNSADVLYAADTDNHRVQAFDQSDPPVITVAGVVAGVQPGPLTIAYSATDDVDGPVVATAQLNGGAFASGTTISTPGEYTLVVTASDNTGNTATKTIAFTVAAPIVSTSASSPLVTGLLLAFGLAAAVTALGARKREGTA